MKILYSDDSIAVVKKDRGILSQKDEKQKNTLPDLLEREFGGEIFPVHRLDRETEGIMVYAKTKDAAARLSRSIEEGAFQKTYLALLCRMPSEREGELSDLLFFDRSKGKVFPVKRQRKGVKDALLSYRILGEQGGLCLAEIFPKTGRTHQIRVQFASRRCPLYGDKKYGGHGEALALFCAGLSFPHPKTKEWLNFSLSPALEGAWEPFAPLLSEKFEL